MAEFLDIESKERFVREAEAQLKMARESKPCPNCGRATHQWAEADPKCTATWWDWLRIHG